MAVNSKFVVRYLQDPDMQKICNKFLPGGNMERGPWIAGGAIRKLWYGKSWRSGDVDIFCQDSETVKYIKTLLRDYDRFPHVTDNASSYKVSNDMFGRSTTPVASGLISAIPDATFKVQVITKDVYASIDDIFDTFDFTICQFATDGNIMVATTDALEDHDKLSIRMVPDTDRPLSINRLLKYSAYGFSPPDDIMITLLTKFANNETVEFDDEQY
jgi:hypothetical protein